MQFNKWTIVFNLIGVVLSQVDDKVKAVGSIFTTPSNSDFLSGFVEVTSSTDGSLGAIEKCGEGADQGVHVCVKYFMCDPATNTVIQEGEPVNTNGFGIIDIRFGANTCNHPLEVCCKPAQGGGIPGPSPTPTTTSTTTPSSDEPQKPTISYCGIRNNNGIDFKISGNNDNEAEYGEFPWMTAILKKNYNPQVDPALAICGGSIINPNVILTGAHCVYKFKTDELKIRAGEWDTQTQNERLPYQERDVSQIILHTGFNAQTLFNDIALLVLSEPLEKAEHIGTLCLPQHNQRIDSRNCFATGWGKDVFGKEGKYQVILKKIELPIVPNTQCERDLQKTRLGQHFRLDKTFICAGGEFGKDTCTGDGGSPLICPDPQNPMRYVQAGLVAWGIGCGEENVPGVYADVTKFRNWIDQEMKTLRFDTKTYTA